MDDRSIGLAMLRPMVPAVFSKPSADVNVKPPKIAEKDWKLCKRVKNGVRKTM